MAAPPAAADDASTHALENQWVYYEHKKMDRGKYEFNARAEFSTVEDFWRWNTHAPKPSQIFTQSGERKTIKYEGEGWHQIEALSVFKKVGGRKVDPAWEDPLNGSGGEFRVADIGTPKEMDKMWRTLLMSLVGETLDPENTINGVRVVDKCRGSSNQYRFEIWTSTKFESAPGVKKAIENELQRILEVRTVKWANH